MGSDKGEGAKGASAGPRRQGPAVRAPASGGGTQRELAILNAIAEALASTADLQTALERMLGLVADLLGLHTGWVWLVDPNTERLYLAAALNLPPYLQEPVRMIGARCLCAELFRQGELRPTNVDVLECSRLHGALRDQPEATLGLRYHASIPLVFQERRLGIINVTGPAWRRLSRQELRLLSTIAYQVGIAVERARLAAESARLARAEERTRIAREIHDTLAQALTAIGLDVEGALRHLEASPERARERLERALATTRRSLDDARRSVLDLRAAPLAGRSLADALTALGHAFTAETGVRVHVRAEGGAPLPLRVEAELYRIAQEALANVRKHARAKTVEVSLRVSDEAARLSIRDDGVGLQAGVDGGSSFGLQGMRERARLLGGRLRLVSRADRGTTVDVVVPLAAEAVRP